MKLEGSIHVVVESRKKKGNEGNMPLGMSSSPMMMKQPTQTNLETTPIKSAEKNSLEKELGSTQLRKTVFKKHYSDKSKFLGEPTGMKGSYDNSSTSKGGQK